MWIFKNEKNDLTKISKQLFGLGKVILSRYVPRCDVEDIIHWKFLERNKTVTDPPTANLTEMVILKLIWEVLTLLAYSIDLASSDYHQELHNCLPYGFTQRM